MGNIINIVGNRYGRLSVIAMFGKNRHRQIQWRCLCDCGNEVIVSGYNLKSGNTSSCGCFKIESTKQHNTKHGKKNTKEYKTWIQIKERVFNPHNSRYAKYSKLGMQEEWKDSFEKFLEDVGEVPQSSEGVRWSIGRIDNLVGYFKENVRWETDTQQARNKGRHSNNTSGITGIFYREVVTKTGDILKYVTTTICCPETGKQVSRSFSVRKYGEQVALKNALDWREKMLSQAMYGEHHGE